MVTSGDAHARDEVIKYGEKECFPTQRGVACR